MDEQKRATLLDELASAATERRERFLDDAGRDFARFIEDNRDRLADLGGLVLIDDEPDYLFVGPDGTFRSRTRYQDDDGKWVSESEDIDSAEELIEIYNPADLYAAFAEAAGPDGGSAGEDIAEEEPGAPGGLVEDEDEDEDVDGAEAGAWMEPVPTPRDKPHAARILYDLALTFQERSQFDQAQLLDDFQAASASVAEVLGDSRVVDDEDERIWFRSTGAFEGEVVPERDDTEDGAEAEGAMEAEWQPLTTPDDMVQFYDPTDLFGDLAEAIAEAYPEVAPEFEEDEDEDQAPADDAGRGRAED